MCGESTSVQKLGGKRFAKKTDTQGGVNFHSNHVIRHIQGLLARSNVIVCHSKRVGGTDAAAQRCSAQSGPFRSLRCTNMRVESIPHTVTVVDNAPISDTANENLCLSSHMHGDLAMARNGILQSHHAYSHLHQFESSKFQWNVS